MLLPSLSVIDNFLVDPWAARREALALDYDPALKQGNFPGLNSSSALPTDAVDAAVSKHLSMKVTSAPDTNHGFCRVTRKADKGRSGVHIDPAYYSGILYLSKPEDCIRPAAGGTDFFRHKRTGLESVPRDAAGIQTAGYTDINLLIDDVVNKDTTSPAKWERTMRIPIRFNRLILFSPWQFHNAAPGFGTELENSRLVMLLFFARA
ncbi:DUF6445 family protein [Roseobacter sp.]|uniref:DUF6445 family protein n=1 Tax=Roseobacter sp. TaxID=1907202 RepID=UPI00386D701F